jgi:hypothetical protein
MPNGIEVPPKGSAYRTEESSIAPVLCHQRSMEEVRGLLPIRPVAYYALPESVAIGAELCPLWVNFALDRVLEGKLVPSLCCVEAIYYRRASRYSSCLKRTSCPTNTKACSRGVPERRSSQ